MSSAVYSGTSNSDLKKPLMSNDTIEFTEELSPASPEILVGPLTEEQVLAQRAKYGANEAEVNRTRFRTLKIFLSAALGPFNLLLLGIAIITLLTEDLHGFIIMITLCILSTLIQFFQEYQSNNIAEKLRKDIGDKVIDVIRAGDDEYHPRSVNVRDIVVGDIVLLKEGCTIPADMILSESKELRVSEAALNGEEHPKKKKVAPVTQLENGIIPGKIDQGLHLCLMGSAVVSGTGKGIVLYTGRSTIYAGIVADASQENPTTPFDKGILRITQLLLTLAATMTVTVFLINYFLGKDALEGLQFAVSVGISIAPELLPVIVNVTQSRGAYLLSKANTRVSKNKAVINLGCMNVLCMDKTGTITENKVTVSKATNAEGKEDIGVLRTAYINSVLCDGKMAVENAIISAYEQMLGGAEAEDDSDGLIPRKYSRRTTSIAVTLQSTKKIFERGFDSHARLQGVILSRHGNYELICKGAVDEVLNACGPMKQRPHIDTGYRAVAIAKKHLHGNMTPENLEKELENMTDLTFVGILYLLDKPKKTAKSTISTLNEQGIKVKMISGDAKETCITVAREVGILPEHSIESQHSLVMNGEELEHLSPELLPEVVLKTQVFAKMRPRHKKIIIETLKAQGHTVGMIGDGLNDVSAIKMADVGMTFGGDLAMPACQDLADVVLGGPELDSIALGVKYGRATFYNTIKYTKTQLSGSLSNAFSNLIAPWVLPFLPMTSTQTLLQNMFNDISLSTLPWDNVDEVAYSSPRQWNLKAHFNFMVLMAPIGSLFDVILFMYFKYARGCNDETKGAPLQTGWFVLGVATQTIVFHVLRTKDWNVFKNRACLALMVSTFGMAFLAMIFPTLPFAQSAFGMVKLDGEYYLVMAGLILLYCTLAQIMKKPVTKITGSWL